MAKQYKKWFKRKIIFKFKLQPIKSPTIPQYSKKSSNQFILKRFIKKFKPSRIRKIKFLLKKRVKKKIWLTWSFKKRNMFRKFSKLKRPSYIHNINPLPRLQYNNKIIYYILLINNQAFNIYNIWNYILHNKAIISYTIPASYKLNNNLNFLITSAIKKKKKTIY